MLNPGLLGLCDGTKGRGLCREPVVVPVGWGGGQRAGFEPYKGIFNFNHVPLLVTAVTGVFTVTLFCRCYGNACPNLTSVQGREEVWNIYGLVKVI